MFRTECNTMRCRLSHWWREQPTSAQNAVIALLAMVAVAIIMVLSHSLDGGASAWTWHIPG